MRYKIYVSILMLCTVVGVLVRAPVILAQRLSDTLVLQEVYAPSFEATVELTSGMEVSSPTRVWVDADGLSMDLYEGERLTGRMTLKRTTKIGMKLIYPNTEGFIDRLHSARPIRTGVKVKVYRVLLNGAYLVFYDSADNYLGYWFIWWNT